MLLKKKENYLVFGYDVAVFKIQIAKNVGYEVYGMILFGLGPSYFIISISFDMKIISL